MCKLGGRDHNATSYSTETMIESGAVSIKIAEIITLRAIALKLGGTWGCVIRRPRRDHNATSYSTETAFQIQKLYERDAAEIITLRAIALKPLYDARRCHALISRDHNATSYSTETLSLQPKENPYHCRDHNATSYSTETLIEPVAPRL